MFNQSEVKEFIIKSGRKWLFPDFTNKLTWFVVTIGATILVTPTVFKLFFYNWLVDTANLNSGIYFTLPELQSNSPDFAIGTTFVVLAIFHNIANRYFLYKTAQIEQSEINDVIEVDKILFKEFLDVFPSDSLSIELLKDHHFGDMYHKNYTNQINRFVDTWNIAEKEFLNYELECKRKELWEVCYTFVHKLATSSHYIRGGPMLSCIPEAYRGTDDWPEHVDVTLKELNELATRCYELHRTFILAARRKLKC